MTIERWLPVPDWENLYEVSDQGRVRALDRVIKRVDGALVPHRGRVLRPTPKETGHLAVSLVDGSRRQVRTVHLLVARAFLGPPPPGTEVCHGDGDPTRNVVDNLRYDTRAANVADMVRHGRHRDSGRVTCNRGHPATSACRWCAAARYLLRNIGKSRGVRTDEHGLTALSWHLHDAGTTW